MGCSSDREARLVQTACTRPSIPGLAHRERPSNGRLLQDETRVFLSKKAPSEAVFQRMLYDALKYLHILGIVLLLGNVTITAFWKAFADRTGDPVVIAFGQRLVTITDFVFTGGGGIIIYGRWFWRGVGGRSRPVRHGLAGMGTNLIRGLGRDLDCRPDPGPDPSGPSRPPFRSPRLHFGLPIGATAAFG